MAGDSPGQDAEKRIRGFQHIITELSTENGELKDKYDSALEDIALLKEVSLISGSGIIAHLAANRGPRRDECPSQ